MEDHKTDHYRIGTMLVGWLVGSMSVSLYKLSSLVMNLHHVMECIDPFFAF